MIVSSIEQSMQDSYRGVRERLGMASAQKPVCVAIKRLPPAMDPLVEAESEVVPVQTSWSMPAFPVAVCQIGIGDNPVSGESNYTINSRWRDIVKQVCDKHRITPMDIRSRHRARDIVAARYEAFYRLREETALSFPNIAKKMGNFDHTTAIHGYQRHKAFLARKTLEEMGK